MGALNQIVAYGVQDTVLTADPKVTFFQAVYKRHTNFAMEVIEQTINGTSASNGRISVTIARNGDLIGEMYMELALKDLTSVSDPADVCWVAERAISAIELTIGGQRVDKHYQRWWRLYAELFLDDTKKAAYGKLTSSPNAVGGSAAIDDKQTVFLPFRFFFNRNPGLYLPLLALQYAEVRLDIDLSAEFDTYFTPSPKVWGNYVFLDTAERYRFAQKGHEYLIEQVQHTGTDAVDGNEKQIRLSYNHPVKELIFSCGSAFNASTSTKHPMWNMCAGSVPVISCRPDTLAGNCYVPISEGTGAPMLLAGNGTGVQWSEEKVSGAAYGPLSKFRLILNGQDRMKEQSGKYFNQMEPIWRHSGNPCPGVYCYNFGLKPEELQPTGTCNFSRIDNAQVSVTLKSGVSGQLDMYAVNYNVLKIQGGQAACSFAN
jgi:hypothetical protein